MASRRPFLHHGISSFPGGGRDRRRPKRSGGSSLRISDCGTKYLVSCVVVPFVEFDPYILVTIGTSNLKETKQVNKYIIAMKNEVIAKLQTRGYQSYFPHNT